jgi:hypothetical protein
MNPSRLHRFAPTFASLLAVVLVGGCAAVQVQPEGELPKPLIVATPAKVAVVITPEAANYVHKESRASVDYEAQLGPAHRQLIEEVFRAEFREAKFFDNLDAARLEPGIHAIFEPRIEQYSFANAKETGGVYCAVTIRYLIHIYSPDGQLVDTLTLTGYGSGPAPRIGNGQDELAIATYAAMRDAAAKFLVQFPALEVAKPLLASQALIPKASPQSGATEALAAAETDVAIQMVPINDEPVAQVEPAGGRPTPASSPPVPQAPQPLQTTPPVSRMVLPRPATEP